MRSHPSQAVKRRMVVRKKDVDEALADAAGIQQVAKDTTDDKVVIVQPTKRCKNPFCQTVLKNAYASCEERQMCQWYRALWLQRLANAEKMVLQNVQALGRGDSFLFVDRAESSVKTHDDRTSIGGPVVVEKEVVDTDATFIIPRRKRSVSSLAAPARTGSNKVTKCAVLESRYPKRLRLGHRIRFTEVMDHFEPRARARPAYASSQIRARRIQEETRRTRAADMVRKARVERRCRRVTTTVDNTASGGRYVRSGNRPVRDSLRGLPLIPRPAYKPPSIPSELNSVSSTASSTAPATLQAEHARPPIEPPHTSTLLTEMQNAPLARTTPIRAEQHNRDRRTSDKYFQGRRSNNLPEPPRPSQDNHQDEYQFGPQMPSLSVQSQTCLNDPSAHRPNIEQRRREFGQRASCVVNYPVDTFHRSYEDSWRLNARRHQYDDHGNRINPREARSITHSNFGFLTVQQEEQRHRYCRPVVPDAGAISYEHRGAYGESAVYLPPVDAIDATTHPTNTHHRSVSPSNPTLPRARRPHFKEMEEAQSVPNDVSTDCEATFSYHEPFLVDLLSQFIQSLPNQLEAVMNVTKKPRKMKWYIDHTKKIERTCKPYMRIQMKSAHFVVLVQHRVWAELKDPSTMTLLQKIIQTVRAETMSWKKLKDEVEKCLELYRRRRNDEVELSSVFTRAWNNLKSRTSGISLLRQSNYFCGSRRHHWNFIVGKVEIGSGSHEEIREAFRLAAASAADFLLRLDDGRNNCRWRPRRRNSTSSETSDDCEFLFVQGVTDRCVDDSAGIALNESLKSTADDDGDVEPCSPPQEITNDTYELKPPVGSVEGSLPTLSTSTVPASSETSHSGATLGITDSSLVTGTAATPLLFLQNV